MTGAEALGWAVIVWALLLLITVATQVIQRLRVGGEADDE